MYINGLNLIYNNGKNIVLARTNSSFPVGALLCRIYQGETLYNISRIVRNCICMCPFSDNMLTQDAIEEAEQYIRDTLLYDDFFPAQRLAQGSFIRYMESYRALNSNSAWKILQEGKQFAVSDPFLFHDVGFTTVGEFIKLCFNYYIIDLRYGIDLFKSMCAVWTGTASDEEQSLFDDLCETIQDGRAVPGIEMRITYDKSTKDFRNIYIISSFLAMAVFEFSHLAESSMKIVRCQNPECRRFFTAKRSSAKYCGFPAPQHPEHTCNDFYPQIVHREKVRADEIDRLIKNAKCRLYNTKRRHPEKKESIENLLTDIVVNAQPKKQEVLNGTLTKTNFCEWLNSHNIRMENEL